jgi:hypothetical protein
LRPSTAVRHSSKFDDAQIAALADYVMALK